MDVDAFIKKHASWLKKNRDSKRAEKEKAYLYSDLKHWGVPVWERKKFSDSWKKELRNLSKSKALSLVRKMWKLPSHEERSMALTVLNLHADKLNTSDMVLIEKLMRESRGWALLDNLIIPIMPEVIKKDASAYKYLKKWIKDKDFWVRRSALLAQLLFFRKGVGGDKKLLFDLAKSQFDESWIDKTYKDQLTRSRARFFIRKAIGWTLREMSIKDPESVLDFLKENKEKMSGLSFREGSRKLPKTLQQKLRSA